MHPKPSKEVAIRYIQKHLPDYGELFSKIHKNGGWVKFDPWLYNALKNTKATDYAKFYPDESVLPKLFFIAFSDLETYKELATDLDQANTEEHTAFLDDWIVSAEQDDPEGLWNFHIPKTPEEIEEAKKLFESYSQEEQNEAGKRAYCFIAFFIINFHNYLALMVHGRKISQLVAEAIRGDDKAFLLTVQIDPTVMQAIPYFHERESLAYRTGDSDFLDKLAYRRKNPPLRGKIRFPLLYLLFAMLQDINILDDLSRIEILDICDASGLDRWQNRIEDVNYLGKRLSEFRRYQNHNRIK
jgi:hypothetical protein